VLEVKVLIISHMYPSRINETYGIFVRDQVNALKELGLDVKVISPVPYTPFPMKYIKKKWRDYALIPLRDRVDGIDVFYPRYVEFPKSYLLHHSGYFMYRGIKKVVAKLYEEFPFDIIHAHVAVPDGHSALLVNKEYNVPLVITIHGQDLQVTSERNQAWREKLIHVLKGADKIITVSGKLKNIIKDKDLKSKTTVINNGINLKDCITGEGGGVLDRDKDINIVSVSNLKKTKGIDLNIEALSPLIKKYPRIKYYIIGDGQERQNLVKLVEEMKLTGNVVFLGKLPHREAMKYMADAHIFSLPSWQEGFGVVYIEAMAHGIPVIGVKGEGIEDVIVHGENGFLVPPYDVDELTNTLDFLIKNPMKAKIIGERGKNTVLKEYTWSKNAEKTLTLYETLLEDCLFHKKI